MDIYNRVLTSLTSWANETPLPSTVSAYPKFQSWHHFDPIQKWIPTSPNSTSDHSGPTRDDADLKLVTWNVDAGAARPQERITEIIKLISGLENVDIVFFQEVSREALHQILENTHIREAWFSSECDDTAWGRQFFATMTLLSKSRFASHRGPGIKNATLGPIWRVQFPSHFGRDALCCDIFVPNHDESGSSTRTRLINVHLDSLPIKPSHRPRQLSIVSEFLRAVGHGLVAGDFNPVLDEDASLVEQNGLKDVWPLLRPEDPGFTWGVNGKQRFPPCRLDKVAVLGLAPRIIEILEPQRLGPSDSSETGQPDTEKIIHWSDHHGLLCSFGLVAE